MSLQDWSVADLETDPFEHGLEVEAFAAGWSDCTGEISRIWWGPKCIPDLLAFIKKLPSRIKYVYFHNGGKFDLNHLLPHMSNREIDPSPTMIGSRIVALKWCNVEFRDSYALVPKPLKSWGKDEIQLWKLKAASREKHKPEICSYLFGDLRNLREMLAEMFERYGRALTLASLTFRIMKRDFGISPIHTSRRFDRHFRHHYFAGRVQFWGLGRHIGNFRILDINSAFPRAMVEKHWWSQGFKTKYGKQKIVGHALYEIRCRTAGGAFALRSRDGIEFPCDGGEFFTTGWEVLAGRASGAVRDLEILCGHYPRKTQDFGAFVRHFYKLKREADNPADRYFAKIILNAFYGKLAQNSENFRETAIMPWRKWPKGQGWEVVLDDKASGRTIFQRPTNSFSDPYCVAAGASITGWVRAELFKVICASKDVLYCDTDSLVCGRPAAHVKIGEELGEWKEEMKCDVVWIGGKKLYVAHNRAYPWHSSPKEAGKKPIRVPGLGWTSSDPKAWKTASKGVRLSIRDLIAVCEGETRTAKQEAPTYAFGVMKPFIVRTVKRADKRKGLPTAAK